MGKQIKEVCPYLLICINGKKGIDAIHNITPNSG